MKKIYTKIIIGFLFVLGAVGAEGQTIANYAYTTNTNGSLDDLSAGSTVIMAGNNDDAASTTTAIGFDFWFMGVRCTHFSANSNGQMSLHTSAVATPIASNVSALAAGVVTLAPFSGDNEVNNGIRIKVIGAAPNRKLVIEWNQFYVNFVNLTNAGNMQVWLEETTGNITYMYGEIFNSASSAQTRSIFLASSNTATTAGSITIPTPSVANCTYAASATLAANTIAAGSGTTTGSPLILNIGSATNVTRTFFNFASVTPTAAPSALTFTGVGATGMTLNWTDNATNEVGYAIYRSTDGINYSFLAQTAAFAGSGTYISTGLSASTLYFWKVYAVTEGALSTALSGSQSTAACSLAGGTYSVGPAGTYATLKAAVDAAVLNGVTGPVIFELNAAYTSTTDATFPIVLGQVSCASSTNTITIRPATGAGTKTITSANTIATLDINGGNYWIIDGRQGGVGTNKDLSIANTSILTGGTAIRYTNEGSNNVVKYSVLKALFPSTTSGVVLFSTTTGTNGNDNNTIDNCDIDGGAAATASPTLVATNGIFSLGSITTLLTYNNNNIISNSNIFDYFNAGTNSAGILTSSGTSDWTIQNNKIYQSTARIFTASGLIYYGIGILNSGANNMLISGNSIGFATNTGTGVTNISGSSNMVWGLSLFVGTTTVSNIQNNSVTAITQTSSRASATAGNGAFYGIRVGASGLLNITGNTIGSLDNSTSISVSETSTTLSTVSCAGIYSGATGAQTISANNIGSITVATGGTGTRVGFTGIQLNHSTGITATVSGNIIGGTTAASGISVAPVNGQAIGIQTQAGISTISGNNIIRNLIHTGLNVNTSGSASVIGISMGSTDNGQTVSQNTIHSLANNSAGAITVTGIYSAGTTVNTSTVSRNLIYNLAVNSASGIVNGIHENGSFTNYQNNMIKLGHKVDGTDITVAAAISGINQTLGTANFYYNSIYIGGAAVVSAAINTYAFNSTQTVNARIFQNNIFVNARSNTSGTGKHYAIRVGGTAPNPSGLTINYNDYFVSGAGGVFGFFNSADVTTLAAWRTGVGQDLNSLSVDPLFISPATTTPNLHITSGTTTLESAALSIAGVTNDFDNDPRPGSPSGTNSGVGPDIGADEFNGINPSLCSGTPAAGGTATSSVSIICAGSNVTFTLTGATSGPGISYQWQTSPAGANTWTDVAGATSTVSSFSITSNTDVRALVKCIPSGLNAPSTTVTVNAVNCQFNIVKSAATFTSISGTGASMAGAWRNGNTNNDDNLSASQSIGFTFPYKGVNYTSFSVSTNGFLTFNVGTAALGNLTGAYGYSNSQLSTAAGTVTSLAPFYEDLVTPGNPVTLAGLNAAMKYQVDGSAPNRVLTVEWIGMETFGNAGPNLNFQVKIYETTGVVEYVYGTMEGFNGTANYTYTYTLGLNGPVVSATPTVTELQTQQVENVQNFSALPANSLSRVPDCNIKYAFTPNTYGSADPTPGAPANDEPATAITVSVNPSPCVSLCGTYYTSKNATASAGITVCSAGTPGTPDDDVWFKFIATVANQTITLRGAGGYDAVVQLFSDAGITSITCLNATSTGLTETINATGLTAGNTYYVRVYHATAGSGTNGDFSICVNEVIPPPANDDICGAINLTPGAVCTGTNGTTIAATASSQAVCGGLADDDVWYKWTALLATDTIKVQSNAGFNAHVQVFSSSDNTCTGTLTSLACINSTSTGGLEFFVGTLTPGNTYFVRVYHTTSGTGTGTFSICAIAAPPACVTGLIPVSGTSVDAATGTTLSWTPAGAPSSPPSGYDVYFDTNNPPTTLISANQAGASYVTGVLAANTVYYWRIAPKNAAGTASSCTISNINTNAPACPTTPVPANASNTCLSASATVLSWATSAGATGYDVYFDPGAGPATTLASTNQPGLTYSAGVLTAGQYAWRVVARNNNGPSSGCSNWTFTVNPLPSINITPAGPINICPPTTSQLLSLGSTTAASPTYQWKNGGVNIAGQTSTSYTATASGTYTLVVTDGVTGCVGTSNVVSVIFNQQPTISITPAAVNICGGASSALTATATLGNPNIKITEVTLNRTGTGQTVTYPAYIGASDADFIEISNVSASPVDLSGLTVTDYGSGSSTAVHTLTFAAATIIPANSTLVVHLGAGTDDLANRYFNTGGTTDNWLSSSLMGVVLKSGSTIVDAVGCGSGFTFNAGTGVTASDWSGFAPSASGFAGVIRSAAIDNNIGADWVQSNSPTPLQTIGTYNGGYTPVSATLVYLWTPAGGLYTDAGTTIAYTNQDIATVYAKPSNTTTYTVKATSGAGCFNTTTSVVTVNPIVPSTTLAGTIGAVQVCSNDDVGASGHNYMETGSCKLISRVVPSGVSPITGIINNCVTIDATVQFFNASPYLQRHFDIEPATSPATATARVTLYALQSEFDAYNTASAVFPDLPTVPGDASGIANLRVTQYHGTGTAPGNYTGSSVFINPADVDIVWNATNNWWEISFDVTGFSGFYIHTTLGGGPLPITINYFNGSKQGSNHLLNWKVTCVSTPKATMTLERSADSRNFTGINTIIADAVRCNQPFNYTDVQPLKGMNYYRLKMVDADGKVSYSGIVALLNALKGFDIISIAPNPVVDGNFKLNVTSATAATMQVIITDMQARIVSRQSIPVIAGFSSIPMNVGNLAAGTYSIQAIFAGEKTKLVRFVKQ